MDKQDISLGIYTGGLITKYADALHSVDQPTPYDVLEKIAESSILTPEDVLVDFGCGRGRVCFYLADRVGCRCVGIERAEPIFKRTMKNLDSYTGDRRRVSFRLGEAEEFDPVPNGITAAYLFNPFAGQIFEKVYENLRRCGRRVKLILYRPDVWAAEFMRASGAVPVLEIDLRNGRFDYPFRRVYVYEVGGE